MAKLSPLASVSATKAVLATHGLTAKKALGQNFLIDDGVVQKICGIAEVGVSDHVLEVGPGIGTLTTALLQKAAHVTSVERDCDLVPVLAETTSPWEGRFTLIQKDALDLEEGDFGIAMVKEGQPLGVPNIFVANLPYSVAATLILDYFQRFPSLGSATVMVQAEVADRICAHPGTKNYGAYTIKLSLYAQPMTRFLVGPQNFLPQPRVESSVIRLDRHEACDIAGNSIDDATKRAACFMADAAFATRRKTIANSCKTYFAQQGIDGHGGSDVIAALLAQAKIDPKIRGEQLAPSHFIELGHALLDHHVVTPGVCDKRG